MQQRYPGRIRESASPSGNSAVFKNWAFRQYQAPTVTYEVGDKTGSDQLHELATFAADSALRILLNESRPDASTPGTGSQGAQGTPHVPTNARAGWRPRGCGRSQRCETGTDAG